MFAPIVPIQAGYVRYITARRHCAKEIREFYSERGRATSKHLEAPGRAGYHLADQSQPTETASMSITIYHNPRCSNSRNALALLREAGKEPVVVDYLANPPSREQLRDMVAKAGLSVRDAMRSKEAVYGELGLADPALSDEALLDAMVAHPVLINRPFVVTPKGVRLCRPPELVKELL
jgi:arsenate reductase (glutaredoxin)